MYAVTHTHTDCMFSYRHTERGPNEGVLMIHSQRPHCHRLAHTCSQTGRNDAKGISIFILITTKLNQLKLFFQCLCHTYALQTHHWYIRVIIRNFKYVFFLFPCFSGGRWGDKSHSVTCTYAKKKQQKTCFLIFFLFHHPSLDKLPNLF